MDPAVILALIANLYQQLLQVQAENAELRAAAAAPAPPSGEAKQN
jgi:hypothetical protein